MTNSENIEVHPTAVVASGAILGSGCRIGPYSVIGSHVVMGRNNRIGPHVVIDGHTKIGDDNQIFQFASIGAPPQDLKFQGEESVLEIGNKNVVREYVTLQPGTAHGHMITRIGHQNLFMACSHVGHDVLIGDQNVFANSAALAGHVTIGNRITIGGLCGIHQFTRLGDFCFLSGGTMAVRDVPPYCLAQGDRAGLIGINRIGLERAGFSADEIAQLKRIYKGVFSGGGTMRHRVEMLLQESTNFALGRNFLEFFSGSQRGVTMPRRANSAQADGD